MAKEFACSRCGVTGPDRMFRDRRNRRQPHCKPCRDVLKKYKDEVKERGYKVNELVKIARKHLPMPDRPKENAMIAAIYKLQAHHRYRAKKYREKIDSGNATRRTPDALERQEKMIAYYDRMIWYMRRDIKRNNLQPLQFYVANTKLMAASGLDVKIDHADPTLDTARYGRYERKKNKR